MADVISRSGSAGKSSAPEPIAIVGMACIFPGAQDLQAYWSNILAGVDAIGEPVAEWDAERYLKSGRINTPYGGFLRDLYRFEPREFGIMPSSLNGGEPDQYLALRVARDALADAGYHRQDYDHTDTGIVLGHSTYLHRGQGTLIQNHTVLDQTIELLHAVCPSIDDERLGLIRSLLASKLPPAGVDIVPGVVPNVMTGRIANRLNFKGPNYLIDAACSSSLLAVNAAMDELRAGRSRLMLAGGVNASLPAEVAVIFTQLGALSTRGKVRPFELGSDGTLLSEGLGVVALKRLSDAMADCDRVYAVLRSVGHASDGRGPGLLAPGVEGEMLSIQRAYSACGVDPASISLIEAHGTGIPLGTQSELSALKAVFGERKGVQGTIAIGSVKSMIGHCIPAAGMAGLIKTVLALQHKILPPTLCSEVDPELSFDRSPFYVNIKASPWISPSNVMRRAGVDSFGFGGINTHAIVEEAPADARLPQLFAPWPAELFVFSAAGPQQLAERLQQVAECVRRNPQWQNAEIAASLAEGEAGGECRLALVAKEPAALLKGIEQALKQFKESDGKRWSTRGGVVYSAEPVEGKLGFLFPGEGSQYLGMFADLAMHFAEVREWFDFWRGLYDEQPGWSRTEIMFPPAAELTPQRRAELERRINDMDVGSESVFIGSQAIYTLLERLGVKADVMLGHSTGESSALAASGALAGTERDKLGSFIRRLNAVYREVLEAGKIPTGKLLAVGAMPLQSIARFIEEIDPRIVVAMDNCANQVVLYGQAESIDAIEKALGLAGGMCLPVPFDRGYHTPAFAEVSEAFLKYYNAVKVGRPATALYSCASVGLFPDSVSGIRKLAASQWSTTVRFRETIAAMYADGVRYFVEVGPSNNLSTFVNDILAGREYVGLATNMRRRGGVDQLLAALAQLYVNRRFDTVSRLFDGRAIRRVDWASKGPAAPAGVYLDNTMPMVRINDEDREALRALAAPALEIAETPGAAMAGAEVSRFSEGAELPPDTTEFHEPAAITGEEGELTDLEQHLGFIDSIAERDEHHLVARCRLNLYQDNFLRDHVLSGSVSASDPELLGLSCVPMMVSFEIMAEACAAFTGSVELCAIENVKAFDWIALDDGEVQLEVRVQVADRARGVYSVSLINGENTVVSGDFCYTPDWRCLPVPDLAEQRPSVWNGEDLYTTGMFHGPVFRSIRHIEGWDRGGIDAELSQVSLNGFFVPSHTPKMVLNPVLLDAMGQLAAYWIAQGGPDFNCFPSTIERIELYSRCPADLPGLKLRARGEPLIDLDDADGEDFAAPRAWQFECLDQSGQPLLRVSNLVNVYFPVPHRFYETRKDPLHGWLGYPLEAEGEGKPLLWELPLFEEDFCAQSNGIFLRILAHIFLSYDEREEWRALQGHVRRKREWLLGRAAVKEAVRYWLYQRTGDLIYPSDVVVLHDQQGAPYVDGWWRDVLAAAPQVSLSHNHSVCFAAVADHQQPVGIDVEEIGRVQQPELLAEALSDSERPLLEGLDRTAFDERLVRFWCAKEAAAKCLGTGLQGRPEAFEVSFADGLFERAFVEREGATVEVRLRREMNSIIAVGVLAQSSDLHGVSEAF
jgi:acyl transferase domain-containing protein/phosphopantetheinyl transferase (holo-ACP synthase)